MSRLQQLLSWVADHTTKTVGFLGALAALGFSTLYIVSKLWPGLLPDTTVSEVTTISPSEIHIGQAADITGANLKDVLSAHLTKGQIDKRIFLLPISDTRLAVSIPQCIDPETYNPELKIEGKDGRLTAGKLEVISGIIRPPMAVKIHQ